MDLEFKFVDVWLRVFNLPIFNRVFLETNFNGSFVDRWLKIVESCSSSELGLVAVTCWSIWNDRNKTCHEESIPSISIRSQWIIEFLRKYLEANLNPAVKGPRNRVSKQHATLDVWSPPPDGFWKFNVDAAWSSSCPATGIGIIGRKSDGDIGVIASKSLAVCFDGPGAEVIAIKEGVELALRMGCSKIIVESDSELAIKFIKKEAEVWSSVECDVASIWKLIPYFADIRFVYIPRKINFVADSIAKGAKMLDYDVIWVENFPAWIVSLVENDRVHIAHVVF